MVQKNIKPFFFPFLETFPFIEQDYFDAVNEWQLLCKMGEKINEIIKFCNTDFNETMNKYFEEKFNDIMINSMYESETETLILYLDDGGEN